MPKTCNSFKDSRQEKFWVPCIVWARIKSDLPKLKRGSHCRGRSQIKNRVALGAILHIIYLQENWNSLKGNDFGCSGTVAHKRYKEWRKAGVFSKLAKLNIEYKEPRDGINWTWLNEIENMITSRRGDIYNYDEDLNPIMKEKDIRAFLETIPENRLKEVTLTLSNIPEFQRFYRGEVDSWITSKAMQISTTGSFSPKNATT